MYDIESWLLVSIGYHVPSNTSSYIILISHFVPMCDVYVKKTLNFLGSFLYLIYIVIIFYEVKKKLLM